ncbi:MAG: hypothetical protein JSV45_06155 [Chromatiales bacterium]|nr:MAG: hypothetical protein JSV45_06155 [Chromatiales bacterium]
MTGCVRQAWPRAIALLVALLVTLAAGPAQAVWYSDDGSLELRGFLDSSSYFRRSMGMTKQRFQGQLEFFKDFRPTTGLFSELSLGGTLRVSYDAVYDINGEYGNNAGSGLTYSAPGNPGFSGVPVATTTPDYAGIFPTTGAVPLPGTGGTISGVNNPNRGLRFAAEELYDYTDGGTVLATPVRPCDDDNRGCINDYMDRDLNELRFREFNDHWDWLRELYLNMTIPTFGGRNELNFRVGRQQVVWGRTDLFRVLDVVNPIDFGRQNIYAEFEDSRIPQGMVNAEYRFGPVAFFEDLNFQVLYKFEEFRPHDLGQGGEPYAILGAGNLFRALKNCWDNGCTVGNFPITGVAVDFPSGSIGIRDADVPDDEDIGARIEGVWKGIGFSFNALYYRSQFPSLRGGIAVNDPFLGLPTGLPAANDPRFYPYNFGFEIEFPRLMMYGASADWYWDWATTSFRIETTFTQDEEFADTSQERLYNDSDVWRFVFGFDRPTFIPFLNKNRAFLISGQVFYQEILDHNKDSFNSIGLDTTQFGRIGFQDWDQNVFLTLLIQGNYMNDRLTPQILGAYDTQAQALVLGPSLEFKPSNNWLFKIMANWKWTDGNPAEDADDNRTANIFPPNTCGPAGGSPICPDDGSFGPWSSLGGRGFEPLGRFKSGPIGTAAKEDELQFIVRYQF